MNRGLGAALRGLLRVPVARAATPRVVDEDGTRCLRFNDGAVQSRMRLDAPHALELAYTRAMMGFLLFNPDPRAIVLVGLGGGSLAKFCHRELPHARLTAVEIDPRVIALREHFLLPPDDRRLRVIEADGAEYLARAGVAADVILLDAYDADGLPPRLCSAAFYADCRNALTAHGVLVANLWGGEPNRALYLERLRGVFGDRLWWCRPRGSSSLIAYATRDRHWRPHGARPAARARALDARLGLGLAEVVADLRDPPDPDG